MRDAERRGLGHGGVRQQRLVDLRRSHLLATPIDQLFEPSGDEEVPVGVEIALVAGAEPAVAEGRRRGRRVPVVARDHVGAADDDLAPPACGDRNAACIDDRDLHVPSGGATDRPRSARGVPRQCDQRRLRQPVRLDERRPEQGA